MLLLRSPWLTALFTLAAMASVPRTQAAISEYTIDPTRTEVSFEVRNLAGIASQRGRFSGATGIVALDAVDQRGSVDIVIDARSLEAGNEAVARFMRGESLLNVEEYPHITFKAVRVVFQDGRPSRIEGELTMRGVTRGLALSVTEYGCRHERCRMDAIATFKRSDFGMTRYMTFTSDEVKLAIRTEGAAG
ncbi:MAG: YceI family protein [Steroidobacteraceae bacterium]